MNILNKKIGALTLKQIIDRGQFNQEILSSLNNDEEEELADASDLPEIVRELLWATDDSMVQRNILSHSFGDSPFVEKAINADCEVLLDALADRVDLSDTHRLLVVQRIADLA
jgi:hypothetical protein